MFVDELSVRSLINHRLYTCDTAELKIAARFVDSCVTKNGHSTDARLRWAHLQGILDGELMRRRHVELEILGDGGNVGEAHDRIYAMTR